LRKRAGRLHTREYAPVVDAAGFPPFLRISAMNWSAPPGASASSDIEKKKAPADAPATLKDHHARIEEDTRCREWLVRADWASQVPVLPSLDGQMNAMSKAVWEYVEWNDTELVKRHDTEGWPTQIRLWACEFQWCMDELQRRGLLPDDLRIPGDSRIRGNASIAAGPLAEDPGNVCWDVMFGLVRLHKYVDDSAHSDVMRTDTGAYGSRASKSSKGSVNFRGNILECVQFHLQQLASPVAKDRGHSATWKKKHR